MPHDVKYLRDRLAKLCSRVVDTRIVGDGTRVVVAVRCEICLPPDQTGQWAGEWAPDRYLFQLRIVQEEIHRTGLHRTVIALLWDRLGLPRGSGFWTADGFDGIWAMLAADPLDWCRAIVDATDSFVAEYRTMSQGPIRSGREPDRAQGMQGSPPLPCDYPPTA